jgi:hypothetical protein
MTRGVPIRLAAAALLLFTTWAGESAAQAGSYRPRHADPDSCHFYARQEAWRYAPPGAGALGGAARGAARGAMFGAIVGGRRAARRGAAAGAALGIIANGARREREREYAYQRAFDDCMDGFRR